MNQVQRISNLEKRVNEIEKHLAEKGAADGTTAIIREQLKILGARETRMKKIITDPKLLQDSLSLLEEQRCFLQSFLQQF